MCDSPNTTDIVETECYLCPTQELCNEFRHSYVNRCKWKVILGRQNEDGDMDGICTDGLDYIAAGFSPGVATIGWLIFLFGIGWLRKDRGKFALLRRHGFEVTADVVERRSDRTVIPTADGLPDLEVRALPAPAARAPSPPERSVSPAGGAVLGDGAVEAAAATAGDVEGHVQGHALDRLPARRGRPLVPAALLVLVLLFAPPPDLFPRAQALAACTRPARSPATCSCEEP